MSFNGFLLGLPDNLAFPKECCQQNLQDNGAVPLWGHWSSAGSHRGRHCRSVWCQSRRKQPQSSSTGIYTPGSLCHAWSTSGKGVEYYFCYDKKKRITVFFEKQSTHLIKYIIGFILVKCAIRRS